MFTLADELPSLAHGDARSLAIARQARMVDDLIVEAIDDEGLTPAFGSASGRKILFHGHCHQKAAGATAGSVELLRRIPDASVDVLDAGCCGMAGSFGFEAEKYEVSMRCGERVLLPAVRAASPDTLVIADGYSCREQIVEATTRRVHHLAEVLEMAIPTGRQSA